MDECFKPISMYVVHARLSLRFALWFQLLDQVKSAEELVRKGLVLSLTRELRFSEKFTFHEKHISFIYPSSLQKRKKKT